MPLEDEEKPMPAIWGYIKRVYAKMEDSAEVEKLIDDEDETGLVYTGHLTGLFQDLNIPNPYYTSVTRALKAMECIVQLRRGGGTATSRWALVQAPTEEMFFSAKVDQKTTKRHTGKINSLEQTIRELIRRVQTLEDSNVELAKTVEEIRKAA